MNLNTLPEGMNLKDLDKLTTDQLLQLNSMVVKLIKIRNVTKQMKAASAFRVGQVAKFTHSRNGTVHKIEILKINAKTVKGADLDTGILWTVSPTMLRPV